jgi:hypothetical protein
LGVILIVATMKKAYGLSTMYQIPKMLVALRVRPAVVKACTGSELTLDTS